ncbi:MAG: hypothetical protein JWN38_19 [Candidatus Saccharibacteria bacterium]|nr:hypothetical protein [Candidatus Saccharibacteria bacterium]
MRLLKKFTNLGMQGSAHIIAPLVVVMGIAVVGTYVLVASHADAATPPIEFLTTAGSTDTNLKEAIKTIDLSTNALKTYASASGSQNTVSDAAYSPDHKYLAWSGGGYNGTSTDHEYIYIQTLATGAKKTVALPANSGIYGDSVLSWAPQSNKLAFTTNDYNPTTQQTTPSIRTVNADGTALTKVYSTTAATIGSFAQSGDGKSVVYTSFGTKSSTTDGLYSVTAGATPVRIKLGSCDKVRTVKGGSSVVYQCTTATGTTFYSSTPGSANAKALYTFTNTTGAGGVSYDVQDLAPSPTGTTVGMSVLKRVTASQANCTYTEQLFIFTMPIAANAARTTAYTGPKSAVGGGCYGGGSFDAYSLQWSPDSSSLAYLKGTPFNQPAGLSLNLLTIKTGASRQLVAAPVASISW